MKILLLVDSLVAGGKERRLIELIKGLKNHNDVQLCLVVFSKKIHYTEIYNLGIPIKILERVPKRNPKVFLRLYKICRQWKPDLIHSWGTMSAIWAIPSSLWLGIKLVNGNIVDAPKNLRFFDKRLFRARLTYPFSKVIISNSLAGLRAYRVPKAKGLCIYNGFDMNRVSSLEDKESIREKFNINTEKVIGMVGSFSDRKDFNSYLNAAQIVLQKRKDVTFISVGDGPNLEKSKKMIPDYLSSRCIFTGLQKDVESLINIFDIGVLSTNSTMHGEGISNVILEYMALRKPTVATKGGGTDEIVKHSKTGFLVSPNSPNEIAERLNYLLENPDVSASMGTEAIACLEQQFSLTKMTRAYYTLYTRLMAKKGD